MMTQEERELQELKEAQEKLEKALEEIKKLQAKQTQILDDAKKEAARLALAFFTGISDYE